MRLFVVVTLIVAALSAVRAHADDRNDRIFQPLGPYASDGAGLGQALTSIVLDMGGGGTLLYLGSQTYSGLVGLERDRNLAAVRLANLERQLAENPRLSRIAELRQEIAFLAHWAKRIEGCAAQVAKMTMEIEALVANRGSGEKIEGQWHAEIAAAKKVLNQTLWKYRLQTGKAVALLTAGGLLVLQVGSRIWIWNYHDADPELFPNFALTYRYGVKPVFRLVGIVDTVENLILGPDGKEERY